jgi:hypothetical protein
VLAHCGTLLEVRNAWTIDDLMDAHEALDIQAEIEHHRMESAR